MSSNTLLFWINISLVVILTLGTVGSTSHQTDPAFNQLDTVKEIAVSGSDRGTKFKVTLPSASPSGALVRKKRALGAIFTTVTKVIGIIKGVIGIAKSISSQAKKKTDNTNQQILQTNRAILRLLHGYGSKLDEFNMKLDRLVGLNLEISYKITVAAMKKDFDLLHRARQWLKQQKLVSGVYKPSYLFRYKNEKDYKDIHDTLTNIHSYLTEQRSFMGNKILAGWLIDSSRSCQSKQYLQVLTVQAAGYEWWKILTVAICQQKHRNKGVGWCHGENAETINEITELQAMLMKSQQQALDELLLQYMASHSTQQGICAIGMGAVLDGKSSAASFKAHKTYSDYFTQRFHGWKPLHGAAHAGLVKLTKYLIERKNADVNAKNWYEWTPLHSAAKSGKLNTVKELLQHGANVFGGRSRYDTYTPYRVAARHGHRAVANYIRQRGGA